MNIFLSKFRAWILFLRLKIILHGDARIFFLDHSACRNISLNFSRALIFWCFVLGIKSLRLTLARIFNCGTSGGGGGWWNPSPEFLICCSISKRFCLMIFSTRPLTWILPRIYRKKISINGNFLRLLVCKITHKSALSFYPQVLLLLLKKVEKTSIFTKKWLDHMLLMTSHLVAIVTDHH